mgnify:CR=1 FL=1
MKAELDFLDLLQRLHSPELDDIMCFITKLGDAGMVWIVVCAALFIYPKTRRCSLAVGLALIFDAILCNVVLKPAFCRVRPCDVNNAVSLLIPRPSDYSFPSGHTLSSVIGVFMLTAANRKFGLPAIPLAALIGFSRLYLYVHFPSDVLASVVIGVWIGITAVWGVKRSCNDSPLD